MKFVLVLLFVVVAVVQGSPITSTDDMHSESQSNDQISDSAMYIQSVSHMAVVDMFSPLMSALSSLDLQVINVSI